MPARSTSVRTALIERAAHEDDGGVRGRVSDECLEPILFGIRRLAFALWNQQPLRVEDDDDAARRHHGKRRSRIEQIVRLDVVSKQAVHAEGAQSFVHHLGELGCDGRLLAVVVADQQVERTGLAARDLFAKRYAVQGGH